MTTIELAQPSAADVAAVPSRWGRRKLALLLGVPAAWAALLLFHPTGDGTLVYPVISDHLGRWQAVHVGMALFIPLFSYVVWSLTTGIQNLAARTARVLLPIGAVTYGLFEGMLGIGAGALVGHVQDLSGADQAVGAALVEDYFMHSPVFRLFEYAGTLAVGGGIIATAIALRHPRAISRTALALLVVSAPLITAHVPPFGPIGLACFMVAVLLSWRSLESSTSGADGAGER